MHSVVIADDRPSARLGLRLLLKGMADCCVIGEASNGDEAVERSEALVPDLLLTDLKMPGMSTIDVVRRLKGSTPRLKIVILTALDDCEDIYRAMAAGADGYFMKDTDPEQLLAAIQQVMAGFIVFQPKENMELVGGRMTHEDQ